MRVLNVNMSLDPVSGGGTAERTFQISRFLAKAGLQCDVLTMSLNLSDERIEQLKSIKLIALECLVERYYIPKLSQQTIKDAVANADIIHLMNHWTILNALVYRSVRKQNKPYVVCPAGALPLFGRSQKFKYLYNRFIGNHIISDANGHIAIGVNEISHFEKYGVEPEKVSLIPNGIDPEDFKTSDVDHFRRKFGLNDSPFILFIGRLNPIKGPDLLLHAFEKTSKVFNDCHLVFAGPDGGMLSELKEKSKKTKIKNRVHFTGYLGGEEKSSAYGAASLLAIPSRQEAMSIVVLEAGIMGAPVLLTDQCGFDEVEQIGGGKVVTATVEGLQHGLVKILKNPDKLKTMGSNLKKHVMDHYTWEKIINKYIDLYNQILSKKVLSNGK
ncbi:MAG: glycosyltransferase family 4 protein [Thermodesulfobacteriota bacterium]|nr:glycosyltransferase family 4 protein [Thermodesulfobacteriota bacterium]